MIAYLKPSMLGDAILVEPSMTAWSQAHGGEPVKLSLSPMNAAYACLFDDNPAVQLRLLDEFPRNDTRIVPNSDDAYHEAHRLGLPFAAGYFAQFGMTPDPDKYRLYYKLFGDPAKTMWNKDRFPYDEMKPTVCICPNARSCMSSVYTGAPPNIKATAEWWGPIVDFIGSRGKRVVNVGSPDGMKIEGAEHWTGYDFRGVARMMASSDLVISVETGLLHLAGGIEGLPIIFLSSATPPSFSSPRNARVVRSKVEGRAVFDQDEVIGRIKDILGS